MCQRHKPGAWTQALHLSRSGSGGMLLIYTFLPLAKLCLGWRRSGSTSEYKKTLKSLPLTSAIPLARDQTHSEADLWLWVFSRTDRAWFQITISELLLASSEWPGLSSRTPWPFENRPTKMPGRWARLPQAFSGPAGESVLSQNLFQREMWIETHPNISWLSQPWLSFVGLIISKVIGWFI